MHEHATDYANEHRSGWNHPPRFHAENRTQPFAAGKNTVPHRLMNGRWMLDGRWQKLFQRHVGGFASLLQNQFQHQDAV